MITIKLEIDSTKIMQELSRLAIFVESASKNGSQWQPITDAPKDGTLVDLWCNRPGDRERRLCDMVWCHKVRAWRDEVGNYPLAAYFATHFMPYPSGPEVGK